MLLNKVDEEMKVAKAEAYRMGEEKEVTEAKCKGLEQEKYQLMKELEELRAGFPVEKEALIKNYQKQVDQMFFFGYQCCMRKNDITQYIPNYPSNEEEDATISGPTQGDKDLDVVGPSDRQ